MTDMPRTGARRARGFALFATATTVALLTPVTVAAQDHGGHDAARDTAATMAPMDHGDHGMMAGPLGLPPAREGSGTSWLPDVTPMFAHHARAGEWELMFHENLFLQYITDGGDRGDDQFGSVNWVMAMARRAAAGGELGFRAMFSAEPLTVGACGYPDLLATGEFCNGEAIVDRQHPHDVFMELSAQYTRALSDAVGLQLYGGPVGEPALGPVAYPHRVSSLANLLAPISHHWLDATHISFGVATLGLFGRSWKLEGSVFNGREPDEDRYDLDFGRLDSYSGRLTLAPSAQWAIQLSGGHLEEAEAPHHAGEPRVDVDRLTASAIHHRPLTEHLLFTGTLAWGRNIEEGLGTDAFLLEGALLMGDAHELFGRAELVEKAAHDLGIETVGEEVFRVGKVTAGFLANFGTVAGVVPGIGVSGSASFLPAGLEPFYGEGTPLGFAVFARLRPARMGMDGEMGHGMAAPASDPDHGMHDHMDHEGRGEREATGHHASRP